MSSSPPDLDRLRDLADDIRVVSEVTEDVGIVGDLVCAVGVGIGVVACISGAIFEFVQLGLDGISSAPTSHAWSALPGWWVPLVGGTVLEASGTDLRGITPGWQGCSASRSSFSCPQRCVGSSGKSGARNWRASTQDGTRPSMSSASWARCIAWPGRLERGRERAGRDPV